MVYLVEIDDVQDFDTSHSIEAFKDYDSAKKYYDEQVDKIKEDVDLDDDSFIVDEDENYFEFYEDGEYNNNHYRISIIAKEPK